MSSAFEMGLKKDTILGKIIARTDSSILQASLVSRDNERVLETQKIPL
jgi:hypothetical protein